MRKVKEKVMVLFMIYHNEFELTYIYPLYSKSIIMSVSTPEYLNRFTIRIHIISHDVDS